MGPESEIEMGPEFEMGPEDSIHQEMKLVDEYDR